MIYAHQHNLAKGSAKCAPSSNSAPAKAVTEKCRLCDAMHHTAMVISQGNYANTITVTEYYFKQATYNFTSIQLILAGGRAPPASIFPA